MNYFLTIILILILYVYLKKEKSTRLLYILLPLIFSNYFFGLINIEELNIKGVFQIGDLVNIFCIFGYIFFAKAYKRNVFIYKHKRIILFFIFFIFFQFFYSIFLYFDLLSSFKIFRIFFKFFSLLFFLNELLKLKENEFKILINVIYYITLFFGILYILNFGFNVKIFGAKSYIVENYYSSTIYRNFLSFPVFSFFVVPLAILTFKNKIKIISILLIILIDVLLVYTRSILLVFFFTIILSVTIKFFKSKNIKKEFSFILLILVSVNLFFYYFSLRFQDQYDYLLIRLTEINKASTIFDVSNAKLRENIIASRIDQTIKTNFINGLGYLREDKGYKYYPNLYIRTNDKRGQIIIGDQTWGNFIASNGFLGLFLLLITMFYPVYYRYKIKLFHERNLLFYAINIALIAELILGFVSQNFNNNNIFKISFYVALSSTVFFNMIRKRKVYEKPIS